MENLLTQMATPISIGSDNEAAKTMNTVANGTGDELEGNVTNIINGVIAALGIAAVIVVIIGGIQYMTSSGDPAKVKKAKDVILYGVIGLIICVLAYAIVNFLIKNIIGQ